MSRPVPRPAAPRATAIEPRASEPLIGREADLAALRQRLERAPLLTVLGPPGIGKTRLARALAATHGAARFCDASEARDAPTLFDAVAQALGARDDASTERDATAHLGAALAALGDVLLVIDNFEQLVDHAPVLSDWARRAPAARIVVTSRERLRLSEEVCYEVQPLSLPTSGAAVERSAAVQLLLARVRQTRVDFALAPAEAPLIAALVARLDGIPLAIELVAPRVAVQGVATVLERLDARMALSSEGPRDTAARQRTLWHALEWSWSLLDPPARAALAQLAVFHGGAALSDADAVLDLAGVPGAPAVLDVLQSLRDKCLLRDAGVGRIALYEIVRAFAADKLAATGAADATAARHAAHYVARAEQLEAAADGLARLAVERENVAAATRWALERAPGDVAAAALALRGALALAPHVVAGAPAAEFFALVEAALAATQAHGAEPAGRATALLLRSELSLRQRRPEPALADAEAALALARVDGRARGLAARAWFRISVAQRARGAAAEARSAVGHALRAAAAAGDARLCGYAWSAAAVLAIDARQTDAAIACGRRALARLDAAAAAEGPVDPREAVVRANLGVVCLELGRLAEAAHHLRRAVAVAEETGYKVYECYARGNLAGVPHLTGELDAAATLYDQAIALCRAVGNVRVERIFLWQSGLLELERGDTDAAAARLERAAAAARAVGDARAAVRCEAGLAAVDAIAQRGEQAAERLAAAAQRAEPDDEATTAALARLGAVVRLWRDAGARAAREAAIAAARALVDASGPASGDVDARLCERLVRWSIARCAAAAGAARADAPPARMHADARWVELPRVARIELGRRRTLRRLLVALARARVEAPGTPLGKEQLIAAGWPGERIGEASAVARLRVAIAALRKLGMQSWLLTHVDGYLLDPDVPLEWDPGTARG